MRPSLLLLATPSSGAACMMPHRSALCAACTRRLMLGEHLSTITVLHMFCRLSACPTSCATGR